MVALQQLALDALFVWIWFCSIAEKIHSVTKME